MVKILSHVMPVSWQQLRTFSPLKLNVLKASGQNRQLKYVWALIFDEYKPSMVREMQLQPGLGTMIAAAGLYHQRLASCGRRERLY